MSLPAAGRVCYHQIPSNKVYYYVDEAADKETYIIKFQAIKCIIMLKQQIRETYTSAKCRTWPGECDSLVLLFMQS